MKSRIARKPTIADVIIPIKVGKNSIETVEPSAGKRASFPSRRAAAIIAGVPRTKE